MSDHVRKKSPRAPSMPLSEAIERALKIYDAEGGRHPVPSDTAAVHLGYKSANSGSALSAIASLRYYGLVERPEEGHLAVAKSLEEYKFAPDEFMRREIILKWLQTPPIFAELLSKYENHLPSDSTLKFALIGMGFKPNSADACLSAFRQSVEFAQYYNLSNYKMENSENEDHVEQQIDDLTIPPTAPLAAASLSASTTPGNSQPTEGSTDRIPVRLSKDRRAWLEIPTPFFSADKERLKAQIDLLLTDDIEQEVDH